VTELSPASSSSTDDPALRAGEKLSLAQKDVTLTGWAVEVAGLCRRPVPVLPALDRAAGKISPAVEEPHRRHHRSNDTACRKVGDFNLLRPDDRKLVTHAPSRAARDRGAGASRSIRSTSTASATNIAFLSA